MGKLITPKSRNALKEKDKSKNNNTAEESRLMPVYRYI
jgi:hypothetical protein